MANDQNADVASEVGLIVDQGEILGSKLAGLVRQKFPLWQPTPTFRKFLEEHAPSVVPLRRSGMDYVYGRVRPGETKPVLESIQTRSTQNPWRAWVSPNGKLDLLVSRTMGTVVVVSRASPNLPDTIRLTPPSSDTHRGIADAFLAQQPSEPLRTELSRLLVEKTDWWLQWMPVLRQFGLLDSWRDFRRRALLASLREALSVLSHETAERVLANVVDSAKPATPVSAHNAVESLRAFVLRVVRQMDERELRALQLPAGAVHASQKSTT